MSQSTTTQKTTTKATTTTTSLLRGLLECPLEDLENLNRPKTTSAGASGDSTTVSTAKAGATATGVLRAGSTLRQSSLKPYNILKTPTTTSKTNQGAPTTNRYQPYLGDLHQNRGKKTTKVSLADLTKCLIDNHIYEPKEFTAFATQKEQGEFKNPEAHTIYWELSTKPSANFTKQLAQAIKTARTHTPDTPYIERIEQFEYDGNELYANLYYQDYRRILDIHNISKQHLQGWFATLAQDNGKRNSIYMCGRASSGKTTIIELLSAFYAQWEIGRAQPQSAQSNFFLQDLVGKRLFHADEILATPLNIDTLKILLEGNKDLASDVKYGDKETIEPRPVLLGTNAPLWINFSTAMEPILERCHYHVMRAKLPKLKYIKPKDENILKYVLKRLYDFAFDGKSYSTWKVDKEIEEAVNDYVNQDIITELMSPFN